MVISPIVFNNIVQKKDFKDQKDIDYLIQICKAYPSFKLPYILLLNYQPDFFNHDFWKKGEEFIIQSKDNLNGYFQKDYKPASSRHLQPIVYDFPQSLDQKTVLQNFLNKSLPKFI
jgi:hypothetical protein